MFIISAGLDKKKSEKLSFEDPMELETKTITSAAKTFLRNLPEPLMTFKMHSSFIAAASKFFGVFIQFIIKKLSLLEFGKKNFFAKDMHWVTFY